MNYDDIMKAKELFGLKDTETVKELQRKINKRIREWHPDVSEKNEADSKEKSIVLLQAKKVLMDYMDAYKISFEKKEVEKYLSPGERWMSQFGNDHIWGA
ncbi:MAG: hypothetical protein JW904_15315 [Spirochaetales bacterium]|nr:hypothetical protein [Spirochaetales bacterium]